MSEIKLKPCPFCGHKVEETKSSFGGATFFICTYESCGAHITFYGNKHLTIGIDEAENPCENFNRRANTETSVTYGDWVYGENGYAHCSECGYEHDSPECVTTFCPGCGAKMEDEEDNQNG